MMTLPPEEKKTIIEQHLKTVLLSEYNVVVSLLEYRAMNSQPDENTSLLETQLSNLAIQKNVLQNELDSINAEIAAEEPKSFMENNKKVELIITALQQRVAELELDKAILRADITMMSNLQENKQEAIQQYNDEISAKIAENN